MRCLVGIPEIMSSGPIISWQIDGETMERVRLYYLGSKITADGYCSREIKRRLFLGRKAVTNLENEQTLPCLGVTSGGCHSPTKLVCLDPKYRGDQRDQWPGEPGGWLTENVGSPTPQFR